MTTPREPRPAYRFLLGVAVLLVSILLTSAGVKSYHDLAAASAREHDLERQIDAASERLEVLRRQLEQIENDPATLERLAREELGMVRPGDVVIVLPEAPTVAPEPAAPAAPADPPR